MGRSTGRSYYKFGRNPDIDTGAGLPEDVVSNSRAYTFPSSASTLKCSSSSASDTVQIMIRGLDASYKELNETVTLTGQTVATTTGSFLRVNRAFVLGATQEVGDIYVQTETAVTSGVPDDLDKVLAKIVQGDGQTLQAVFTVPKNYYAFHLHQWYATMRSGAAAAGATLHLQTREENGVFRVRSSMELHSYAGGTIIRFDPEGSAHGPLQIPAGSDIRVRVTDVSANNSIVSAAFEGDLVRRDSA